MISEKVAKKLGEVLAFASIGLETLEKGRTGFTEAVGEETYNELVSYNTKHVTEIKKIAEETDSTEIVMRKLESTGDKLRKMRDLYVGDEWDNPTELMEWSGFFEGAAIVHWALIAGVSDKMENEDLANLTDEALGVHEDLFEIVMETLEEVGQSLVE